MPEDPNPTPTPTPTPTPAPDLAKAVQNLADKHGGMESALKVLLGENYEYRDQLRSLKDKVPKEGAVVLKDDEVKHWNSYRELGSPSDVRKAVEDGKQAVAANGLYLKKETLSEAANLHGFKPSVLWTLAKDLEVEVKELPDKKDGKTVRAAFVKDGDKSIQLDKYAEERWGDHMPALKPDKPRTPGPPSGNNPGGPPPSGERKRFKTANSL